MRKIQVDGLSLCIYYRGSTGIISKTCMNEDSVALIMCEKCVYRIRILKKTDLELSAGIFLKDTFCLRMVLIKKKKKKKKHFRKYL